MSRQSDHDRALERLLRAMRPDEPAATAACVDAERLAAWSEGGLSLAERESVDAHLASCGRCLAMLAVFAETAAVPHEGSVPAHEVGLTPRVKPILRPRSWRLPTRWLVPITTAAAAVLIWMVLPARPPAPEFRATTQVARDEAAQAAPAAPAPQRFDDRLANQARETGARQAPAEPAPAPAASKFSESAAPAATDERRRQSLDRVEEAPAQEPAAKAEANAAVGRENETMSDRAAAATPSAPPPAMLGRVQSLAAAIVEIQSPDPAVRWRIRGAVVERSLTSGSSWQAATIPGAVTVTAGSSPSPNVCWLVGPAGTVLRTTDGSRFELVSIPGAGALVSIQATDANRATVTAADGRVYVTTDGGRNWTR